MATIANAAFISTVWHCFFYSTAFFDCAFCKVSLAKMACAGKRCSASAFWFCFFPFPYTFAAEQGKQFGHMLTYDRFGSRSDVVQMSFRMWCFSDHMGFLRDKSTVKMQTFRERRLRNFLFSNLVLLIAFGGELWTKDHRIHSWELRGHFFSPCLFSLFGLFALSQSPPSHRIFSNRTFFLRLVTTWTVPRTIRFSRSKQPLFEELVADGASHE